MFVCVFVYTDLDIFSDEMTSDKASNRSGPVKALLIRAWRERWSHSQFGTQIKSVLGKGGADEDSGLSDNIIQLAVNGAAPNQLLLSLLDHSLASQVKSWHIIY
ncbi:mediator of RNA polymerase II transcription subunit 24-like [Eurytemora carolleeae]|uniref:mediator of RNA polymerase II transcription subunit 24-like n=1 Tax=Eurytemora carolleeae TaxID=1294199 RepID=UPI000C7821CF|nr:mediator of RNA polymerase II transcription subunit 24-like [Eurytemora carolleeae]|eukprot:XP_023336538.1 mediator of RNA polymerase II transcription subunit 24-like [Eurytemora affinis]